MKKLGLKKPPKDYISHGEARVKFHFLFLPQWFSIKHWFPTLFLLRYVRKMISQWLLYVCPIARLCLTLYYALDCSPSGSPVHGISQARILEWVATSSFRRSSWSRHRALISCIGGWILYPLDTWEAPHKDTLLYKDQQFWHVSFFSLGKAYQNVTVGIH